MNTLKLLYKKRDKINSKIKKLDDKLIKINKEIYKIENKKVFKAHQIIFNEDFEVVPH